MRLVRHLRMPPLRQAVRRSAVRCLPPIGSDTGLRQALAAVRRPSA